MLIVVCSGYRHSRPHVRGEPEKESRLFLCALAEVRLCGRVAKETGANAGGDKTVRRQPVVKKIKIGPNDPCPCGSGKKYKKCCRDKDLAAERGQNAPQN